jgi:hypothetical protein
MGGRLTDGPAIFETLDTIDLTQYIGFGGNSDEATGPRWGCINFDPGTFAGLNAPEGSMVVEYLAGQVQLYLKTGPFPVDWDGIGGAKGATMEFLADVGAGATIPTDKSYNMLIDIGGGVEVNPLGIPTFLGQQLVLVCQSTSGGTRTVIVDGSNPPGINKAGDATIDFAAVGDFVKLEGVFKSTAALSWQLIENDGATIP